MRLRSAASLNAVIIKDLNFHKESVDRTSFIIAFYLKNNKYWIRCIYIFWFRNWQHKYIDISVK